MNRRLKTYLCLIPFLVQLIVTIIVVILAQVIVPLAVWFLPIRWRYSKRQELRGAFIDVFPSFLWLFGNEEDGVSGPYTSTSRSTQRWIAKMWNKPLWYRRISWTAWRNPVSNERWLYKPLTNYPDDMIFWSNSTLLIYRYGWRLGISAFFWRCHLILGPKIFIPRASKPLDRWCGFKIQFRRARQNQ